MFYQISDGRLWNIEAAQFVDQAPEGAEIIPLYADGTPAGEDYLRRTLEFYGYPVGPELLTLEELKAAKLAQINEGCQSALAALTPTYPEKELLTFERQEREARALLAGDGSDVAHITAIASDMKTCWKERRQRKPWPSSSLSTRCRRYRHDAGGNLQAQHLAGTHQP